MKKAESKMFKIFWSKKLLEPRLKPKYKFLPALISFNNTIKAIEKYNLLRPKLRPNQ